VLQDAGGRGDSTVVAINDAGQCIGTSFTPSGGVDAVLWSPSGKATVLRDVGDGGHSVALALNDVGWSVGFSFTAGGYEAVLWSPSGKATNLGGMLGPAWTDTEAVRVNNSGDIIGYGDYHGGFHGFLLMPELLSALSATPIPEPSTWAMLLAGFAGLRFAGCRRAKKGRDTVAAYRAMATGRADFPHPALGHEVTLSQAVAINSSGQSIGYSHTSLGEDAVLWSPSGKATDLGAVLGPAWTDTFAEGINISGDIIGYGD